MSFEQFLDGGKNQVWCSTLTLYLGWKGDSGCFRRWLGVCGIFGQEAMLTKAEASTSTPGFRGATVHVPGIITRELTYIIPPI